jgi:hypothetical protein
MFKTKTVLCHAERQGLFLRVYNSSLRSSPALHLHSPENGFRTKMTKQETDVLPRVERYQIAALWCATCCRCACRQRACRRSLKIAYTSRLHYGVRENVHILCI